MCYHKQNRATLKELSQRYNAKPSAAVAELYQPTYHESGFSFRPAAVICTDNASEFQLANWGLIPFWAKTHEDAEMIKSRTLNCISEEMNTKPSFRDAVKRGQRCIVPCTGFFEWRHVGKNKYPYFISIENGGIFSLAGLYSDWTNENGVTTRTYTVLTTAANSLMEQIHNSKKRMPVILEPALENRWIARETMTKEEASEICQAAQGVRLTAHTISKMITDRKVANKNTQLVTQPISYPELPELDLLQ